MPKPEKPDEQGGDRREFIQNASNAAMVVGLAGGYGGLGAIALRYLYPAHGEELSWQFVTEVEKVKEGEAIRYRGPAGETINIARQGRGGGESDFIALSSTCPHLGCQVRWENQNNHFFCPCHNGVFDPSGTAIGGPPAEAGQSLAEYPLKIEGGLLHIAVPTTRLTDGTEGKGEILVAEEGPEGPGHDPCLCAPPKQSNTIRRG
jgi:cytochrome b6-f complex iron-sulfur subunit